MWIVCRMEFTIWKVVELSSPVDISSMKRARPGVTSISAAQPCQRMASGRFLTHRLYLPVVTLFFCPPDMPLNILLPTSVSAQISNPKTFHN
ncbi:hypothetical protein CFC21_071364 [Triticum aestivum]|uniref:Uncharacterized protein n=3 Tax=Triticum TaxID=4564 RepID=A0A9R0X848_TRITD|nr:hypothetical protein CFC21_071364 [Triticum aestivum]VAI31701.1 unnamed protein product [Triticum turgidum subsp. durum]